MILFYDWCQILILKHLPGKENIGSGLAIPHFKTASGNKDEVSVLQMGQSYAIHFIKLGGKSFKGSSLEDEESLFISREDLR